MCPLFLFLSVASKRRVDVDLIETLTALVAPVVAERQMELVEIQFRQEQVGWVLRLVIDKEAGVSLDDCAAVSREVGNLLEVEDLIHRAYTLEVSSPGLTRALKGEADFRRFVGRKARVTVREPNGGSQVVTGTIDRVIEGVVCLVTEKGPVELLVDHISKARLDFDF